MSAKSYGLRRARKVEQISGAAWFDVETEGPTARVELSVPAPGVVRYRIHPSGAPQPDRFDLLVPGWAPGPAGLELTERDEDIVLEAYGTRVEVRRDPWTVSVSDRHGRAAFFEYPADLNARGDSQSKPSGFDEGEDDAARTRVTFGLDAGERLFGLGEKFTAIDKRGQQLVAWNRNPYGAGTELAYKNIPFMVSSRGYGLFLNDTRRSVWTLGSESNFAATIEVEGDGLDLFVIIGPSMKDVLSKYADLTGHAPLPPRWSFGVWISPLGEHLTGNPVDQQSIIDLAEELRRREFPSEVLHLDPFWMRDGNYSDLVWDREWFPDPERMIESLREKGFRLCLWEHPYIDKRSEMYREGAEKGYFITREDGTVYDSALVIKAMRGKRTEYGEQFYDPGGIVDFSNPDAAEWYKSKHRPLLEMGVAAFKTDFGEEIPEDGLFANGKTGAEMHNAYPLLYNQAVFEVTREYTDQPVVWGRSSFAGIQRYPIRWSGDPVSDFPSLAATLRGGLSQGMSGDPFWTFDLGGYKGEPTPEAYVRWVQAGMLLSHSRFHGTTPRMPWHFGEEIFEIVKRYAHLRYRLLPYIYGLSLESTRTNVPVMRPLGLEFEDDPGSMSIQTEYLLGPWILVAPVLNPEGEVQLYLPPGDWYDLWTGEKKHGPSACRLSVDLDVMPVYVRGDAILPFAEVSETVPDLWDPLRFDIYPHADGQFEIPEEGGLPPTVARVGIGGSKEKEVVARGPERAWNFVFRDADQPGEVSIAAAADSRWEYDPAARNLEIHVGRCESVELKIEE